MAKLNFPKLLLFCITFQIFVTYSTQLTIITPSPLPSNGSSSTNVTISKMANDEEISMTDENSSSQPIHIVDRQPWLVYPSNSFLSSSDQPTAENGSNFTSTEMINSGSSLTTTTRNCSYRLNDVFCDCDLAVRFVEVLIFKIMFQFGIQINKF